ncbi:MAG: hypothetical protein V4607_09250 [Pseudomonadota bacterium]
MKKTPLAFVGLMLVATSTAAIAENNRDSLSQFTVGIYGSSNSLDFGNSDLKTFTGTGSGASIQFAPNISDRNKMLFIADYAHENNEAYDVLEIISDRFNFTAGFMGGVGKNSHWFAGAKYSSHKLKQVESGYTLSSSTKTGFGATGGFIFPFADAWTIKGSIGASHFAAKDGDPALDLGVADAGIEFRPIPLLGLTLGAQANYYIDSDNDDNTLSLLSGRIGLNFHF